MQNEMIILIVGVILVVGLIALSRVRRWTTLATARGDNTSELEAKNSYLQSHNIRSRIKAADAAAVPASGFTTAAAGYTEGSSGMYRLEVKPQDKDKAEALLGDYERERLLHADPTL